MHLDCASQREGQVSTIWLCQWDNEGFLSLGSQGFPMSFLSPHLSSLHSTPKIKLSPSTGVSNLNSAESKHLDIFFETQNRFQTISFLVLFLTIFLFSSVLTCKAWDIGYFYSKIWGRWESCCAFRRCALNQFIKTRLAWKHNCFQITIVTYFKYLEILFSTFSAGRSCKILESRPEKFPPSLFLSADKNRFLLIKVRSFPGKGGAVLYLHHLFISVQVWLFSHLDVFSLKVFLALKKSKDSFCIMFSSC